MMSACRLSIVALAAAAAGCGEPSLSGRACSIPIRVESAYSCPRGQSVEGLAVVETISGATTKTGADGRFDIVPPPKGDRAVLRVAGTDDRFKTSLREAGARRGGVIVPMIAPAIWQGVIDATGAEEPPGTGAVIVHALDGSDPEAARPVAGVGVTAPGVTVEGVYYQQATFSWDASGETGDVGIAVVIGVPPGEVELAVTGAGGDASTGPLPVEASAVTFVTVDTSRF